MSLARAEAHANLRAATGDAWARERAEAQAALLDAVAARRAPPGTFVDAGGGDGALARLAEGRGYRAAALDLLGAPGGLRADFARLPVRGVDVVAFCASLHYDDDLDATLAEAARALAPGGIVAIALTPVNADPVWAERGARRMQRRIPGYRHLARVDLVVALAPFRDVEWLPSGIRMPWHRRVREALRPHAYAEFPLVVARR